MNGIQVINQSGKVLLDTSITTWNYLASVEVGGGESAAGSIAQFGMSEAIVLQFLVNDSPTNQEGYAHSVTADASGYSIGGGNQQSICIVLGH